MMITANASVPQIGKRRLASAVGSGRPVGVMVGPGAVEVASTGWVVFGDGGAVTFWLLQLLVPQHSILKASDMVQFLELAKSIFNFAMAAAISTVDKNQKSMICKVYWTRLSTIQVIH